MSGKAARGPPPGAYFVLGSLWEAEPTEQEQRQILRENALRILDLDR